uniref:RNA-directed RNA polymerase n=1 Tax=Phytophthora palustris botybirna-like virus 1-1 TaxID=2976270 RepID=A0A9E9BZW7_9VIRU|nr:RNA-dependent RNA polymerase [Phytophthora palustris botybirna-like virus 1-1]
MSCVIMNSRAVTSLQSYPVTMNSYETKITTLQPAAEIVSGFLRGSDESTTTRIPKSVSLVCTSEGSDRYLDLPSSPIVVQSTGPTTAPSMQGRQLSLTHTSNDGEWLSFTEFLALLLRLFFSYQIQQGWVLNGFNLDPTKFAFTRSIDESSEKFVFLGACVFSLAYNMGISYPDWNRYRVAVPATRKLTKFILSALLTGRLYSTDDSTFFETIISGYFLQVPNTSSIAHLGPGTSTGAIWSYVSAQVLASKLSTSLTAIGAGVDAIAKSFVEENRDLRRRQDVKTRDFTASYLAAAVLTEASLHKTLETDRPVLIQKITDSRPFKEMVNHIVRGQFQSPVNLITTNVIPLDDPNGVFTSKLRDEDLSFDPSAKLPEVYTHPFGGIVVFSDILRPGSSSVGTGLGLRTLTMENTPYNLSALIKAVKDVNGLDATQAYFGLEELMQPGLRANSHLGIIHNFLCMYMQAKMAEEKGSILSFKCRANKSDEELTFSTLPRVEGNMRITEVIREAVQGVVDRDGNYIHIATMYDDSDDVHSLLLYLAALGKNDRFMAMKDGAVFDMAPDQNPYLHVMSEDNPKLLFFRGPNLANDRAHDFINQTTYSGGKEYIPLPSGRILRALQFYACRNDCAKQIDAAISLMVTNVCSVLEGREIGIPHVELNPLRQCSFLPLVHLIFGKVHLSFDSVDFSSYAERLNRIEMFSSSRFLARLTLSTTVLRIQALNSLWGTFADMSATLGPRRAYNEIQSYLQQDSYDMRLNYVLTCTETAQSLTPPNLFWSDTRCHFGRYLSNQLRALVERRGQLDAHLPLVIMQMIEAEQKSPVSALLDLFSSRKVSSYNPSLFGSMTEQEYAFIKEVKVKRKWPSSLPILSALLQPKKKRRSGRFPIIDPETGVLLYGGNCGTYHNTFLVGEESTVAPANPAIDGNDPATRYLNELDNDNDDTFDSMGQPMGRFEAPPESTPAPTPGAVRSPVPKRSSHVGGHSPTELARAPRAPGTGPEGESKEDLGKEVDPIDPLGRPSTPDAGGVVEAPLTPPAPTPEVASVLASAEEEAAISSVDGESDAESTSSVAPVGTPAPPFDPSEPLDARTTLYDRGWFKTTLAINEDTGMPELVRAACDPPNLEQLPFAKRLVDRLPTVSVTRDIISEVKEATKKQISEMVEDDFKPKTKKGKNITRDITFMRSRKIASILARKGGKQLSFTKEALVQYEKDLKMDPALDCGQVIVKIVFPRATLSDGNLMLSFGGATLKIPSNLTSEQLLSFLASKGHLPSIGSGTFSATGFTGKLLHKAKSEAGLFLVGRVLGRSSAHCILLKGPLALVAAPESKEILPTASILATIAPRGYAEQMRIGPKISLGRVTDPTPCLPTAELLASREAIVGLSSALKYDALPRNLRAKIVNRMASSGIDEAISLMKLEGKKAKLENALEAEVPLGQGGAYADLLEGYPGPGDSWGNEIEKRTKAPAPFQLRNPDGTFHVVSMDELRTVIRSLFSQRSGTKNTPLTFEEFFARPWLFLTQGSVSSRDPLYKVALSRMKDGESFLKKNRTKAAVYEYLTVEDVRNSLYDNAVPVHKATAHWKVDELGKKRAIFASDFGHSIIGSYLEYLAQGLVATEEAPTIIGTTDYDLSRDIDEAVAEGYVVCGDYDDFNASHTSSEMHATLDELVVEIEARSYLQKSDLQLLHDYASSMFDSRFFYREGEQIKEVKTAGGLFSGVRNTSTINTVLNLAYSRMFRMDAQPNEIKLIRCVGDDSIAVFTTRLAAMRYLQRFMECNKPANITKQSIKHGSGEFLRTWYSGNKTKNGSVLRALAKIIHGSGSESHEGFGMRVSSAVNKCVTAWLRGLSTDKTVVLLRDLIASTPGPEELKKELISRAREVFITEAYELKRDDFGCVSIESRGGVPKPFFKKIEASTKEDEEVELSPGTISRRWREHLNEEYGVEITSKRDPTFLSVFQKQGSSFFNLDWYVSSEGLNPTPMSDREAELSRFILTAGPMWDIMSDNDKNQVLMSANTTITEVAHMQSVRTVKKDRQYTNALFPSFETEGDYYYGARIKPM